MSTRPVSLLSLPTEILLLITEYLDNIDLDSLLGVTELSELIGEQFGLLTDHFTRDTELLNIARRYDPDDDAERINSECLALTRLVVEISAEATIRRENFTLPEITQRVPTTVSVFTLIPPQWLIYDELDQLLKVKLACFSVGHCVKDVSFVNIRRIQICHEVIDPGVLSFPALELAHIGHTKVISRSSSLKLRAPVLQTLYLVGFMELLLTSFDFTVPSLTKVTLSDISDTVRWCDQSCPFLTDLVITATLDDIPTSLAVIDSLSLASLLKLTVESQEITQISNLKLPSLKDMNISTTSPMLSIFGVYAPNAEHIGIKAVELEQFYANDFSKAEDVEFQLEVDVQHDGVDIDMSSLSSVQFFMTQGCISALEFTKGLSFLCIETSYFPVLEQKFECLRSLELTGIADPGLVYQNLTSFGALDSLCFTNGSQSIDVAQVLFCVPTLKQLEIHECYFQPLVDLRSEHLTHLTILNEDTYYPAELPMMSRCVFPNLEVLKVGARFELSLSDSLEAPLLREAAIVLNCIDQESLTVQRFEQLVVLEIVCDWEVSELTICDCSELTWLEVKKNAYVERLSVSNTPKLNHVELDVFEKPPTLSVHAPLLEREDYNGGRRVHFFQRNYESDQGHQRQI